MEWGRAELLPGLKGLLNWVCHREMLLMPAAAAEIRMK